LKGREIIQEEIMSVKNALYLVAGAVVLMGVWGLLVVMVPSMAFGLPVDPWWHAVLKVVLGGYGLYVAYSAK
jgi:hypothetical protein